MRAKGLCKTAAVTGVVLFLSLGQVSAGILATDDNAMPGWRETKHFDTANIYGVTYYAADIDFAVYDKGDFFKSFDIEPNADHYVYAYQITKVYDGFFGPGTGYVTRFSVGLSGENEQPANPNFVGPGLVAPSSLDFAPPTPPYNTVGWNFSSGVYAIPSQDSTVLYFSSPFAPEWDNAAVTGAYGLGDSQTMPSPTPEPATLTICILGAAGLLLQRRRRQA